MPSCIHAETESFKQIDLLVWCWINGVKHFCAYTLQHRLCGKVALMGTSLSLSQRDFMGEKGNMKKSNDISKRINRTGPVPGLTTDSHMEPWENTNLFCASIFCLSSLKETMKTNNTESVMFLEFHEA